MGGKWKKRENQKVGFQQALSEPCPYQLLKVPIAFQGQQNQSIWTWDR